MPEMEYYCTQSAHNPESLTQHMNTMAGNGWDLLTVDFAIRGETGFHTFFWRRPVSRSAAGTHVTSGGATLGLGVDTAALNRRLIDGR